MGIYTFALEKRHDCAYVAGGQGGRTGNFDNFLRKIDNGTFGEITDLCTS